MSHPLERSIDAVRRRAQLCTLLYAFGWTLAIVIGAVVLLCLFDYLFRYQDPGLRVLSFLVAVAAFVWSGYRLVFPAVRNPMRPQSVAQGIQRRYPGLKDQLATALDFLRAQEEDPLAGSPALRRAVISQATAELEGMNLKEAVDPRPARRAAGAAVGMCVLAASLVALDTYSSGLALSRLAQPWRESQWPRHNQLKFRDLVQRVGRGDSFEVELVDLNDNLPDAVRIHYRFPTDAGGYSEETAEMQRAGSTMVARRENIQLPFEYRAEGGDDTTMSWIPVEVVELPSAELVSVRLQPPQYTGWRAHEGQAHIVALRGTHVAVTGIATKPLSEVVLRQADGPDVAGRIAEDGVRFTIPAGDDTPFAIDKSGEYWIELVDVDGFVGGRDQRWEIRSITDQPPQPVLIEQPAEDLAVLPEATIPLEVDATDDVRLAGISLRYMRSDQSDRGDQQTSLWTADEAEPVQEPAVVLSGRKDVRTARHKWDLGQLGLQPGVQLSYYASATDRQPMIGQSLTRAIKIITSEELAERIARSQSRLLSEISRVLKMQEDGRTQTSALEEQLRGTGSLRRQDVDQLQSAERNQRDITRSLVSPNEGVAAMVSSMRSELEINHLDSPDLERQMAQVSEELARLGSEALPVIERELTSAIKSAQATPADLDGQGKTNPDVEASIALAGRQQQQVIDSLRSLVSKLGEAEDYRQFSLDVADIRRSQQELAGQTARMLPDTLAKRPSDLNPQQQTDLRKLAQQQDELSRRMDRVQARMAQSGEKLNAGDPLVAGAVEDALHTARSEGISGQMRESGAELASNQLGQSLERQNDAIEKLGDVLDILSNRREHELSRLVKKLREAKAALAALTEQQQRIASDMANASELSDATEQSAQLARLAQKQKQLSVEASRLSRELQRLEAAEASDRLNEAGGSMKSAAQAGEKSDAAAATEQAKGAQEQLEHAQEELEERLAQAQQDLADELTAKLQDEIKSLRDRQVATVAETDRLVGLLRQSEILSPGQRQSLLDLTKTQSTLKEDTDALGQTFASIAVFQFGVQKVSRKMALAAGLLERELLGQAVLAVQKDAIAGLERLLTALEREPPDPPDPAAEQKPGGAGAPNAGAMPQQDGVNRLAELKLLKMLQEEVNRETERLQAEKVAGEEPTREDLELEQELAKEQQRLANIVRELLPATAVDADIELPDENADTNELEDLLLPNQPSTIGEPDEP